MVLASGRTLMWPYKSCSGPRDMEGSNVKSTTAENQKYTTGPF